MIAEDPKIVQNYQESTYSNYDINIFANTKNVGKSAGKIEYFICIVIDIAMGNHLESTTRSKVLSILCMRTKNHPNLPHSVLVEFSIGLN